MPTALELTPEGWGHYIKAMSLRSSPPGLTLEEKRERKQLLERVQKAVEVLKSSFTIRRVILFGSLAHASWFMSDSDVDLAIEGLASEDYWQAWRLVEDIIKDRPIDLIEIETAGKSLRRAIERYGVEL